MNNIYFFTDVYNLTLLFIILITGILLLQLNIKKDHFILNTQEVILLINHKNSLLIDVRSKEEYNINHISGSINIPKEQITEENKIFKTKKPIILICKNGNISKKLANLLQKKEINVFSINGGINSWIENDLPLIQ